MRSKLNHKRNKIESDLAEALLCEALPRALRPSRLRAKHRETRGESRTHSTVCNTQQGGQSHNKTYNIDYQDTYLYVNAIPIEEHFYHCC